MFLDLDGARDLAHKLRFVGEGQNERPVGLHRTSTSVWLGRRWGLEISEQVTPRLFEVVTGACARFGIPKSAVRVFVHPDAVTQAGCFSSEGKCIVELTSVLVERLDDEEIAFVVGHELGHFLLDHHYLPLPPEGSFNRYKRLRAREISADRIGLFSCGSPEAAMRASMKVFSGLSDRHLRFDAAAFLRNAFNEKNREYALSQPKDTHPSFAVRARALMHIAPLLKDWGSDHWVQEISRVEQRIERDFDRFGEAGVTTIIRDLEEGASQWIWVASFLTKGRITGDQIDRLTDRFGVQFAQKLRSALSGLPKSAVKELVSQNLDGAIRDLSRAVPDDAKERLTAIVCECEDALGIKRGTHPSRGVVR